MKKKKGCKAKAYQMALDLRVELELLRQSYHDLQSSYLRLHEIRDKLFSQLMAREKTIANALCALGWTGEECPHCKQKVHQEE